MRVEATAALVLVVLLGLLLLFLLMVSLCLLKLMLLRRWRLLLLARQTIGGSTAGGKLKPRGGGGVSESRHVCGGGGQGRPHLARGGGVALGMRRVDMLRGRVWRSHVVGGRGGLTLWGEGGWHGLLSLVHHMALVVWVALHQTGKIKGIVVMYTNLLQVVHGCCSLDGLLIRRWFYHT